MKPGKQLSVYLTDGSYEYVEKKRQVKESFSACLSRLLIEHKKKYDYRKVKNEKST